MSTHQLNFQDFTSLARSLANRIAWSPDDREDLMQEGLVALHLAFQRTPEIENPHKFARTVLSRTMQNHYSLRDRRHAPPSSLDESYEYLADSSLDDIHGSLELQEYLERVGERLGRKERWIAENLLYPGEEVLAYLEKENAERESRNARPQGKVTYGLLARILGVSVPEWYRLMERVRIFTKDWIAQ